MIKDKETAAKIACGIAALVFRSIGDYSRPNDGFCLQCPAGQPGSTWNFQNCGETLRYVLDATIEKLKADGIEPRADIVAELHEMFNAK